jgi:RNA polymerase sigma factor (sigma-70 family)
MATSPSRQVLKHLRRTALGQAGELTDGQLLDRFLAGRDGEAFAEIVRRHGPMVLGVCRRVLGNVHDADDAFQATFLVLVRKAGSVRPRGLVGNWLYGVAWHTAARAHDAAARRRAREKQVSPMPEQAAPAENLWQELQPLLDRELSRLPDRYRAPVVLCDLEGKTRKEAARVLGCPEGTVSGRLSRAREMLARRLARHGVSATGTAVAAALGQSSACACVPPALAVSTVAAGTLLAVGEPITATAVSAHAAALTEGVLKTMLLTKLRIATGLVLAFLILGATAGFLTYQALAEGRAEVPQGRTPAPAPQKPGKPITDREKIQGTWDVVGIVANGRVEAKDQFEGFTMVFVGDKVSLIPPPTVKVPTKEFAFKLDPTKKPAAINTIALNGPSDGQTILGIYQLEGATLRLCLGNTPEGGRPTEFESKEGSDRVLMTLQRPKAPGRKPPEKEKPDEPTRAKPHRELLLGRWQAVHEEINGTPLPIKNRLGRVVLFEHKPLERGDQVKFPLGITSAGASHWVKYTLDETKQPPWIDIHAYPGQPDARYQGIYELKGDTLRICLGHPGVGRPSEFKTAPASRTTLLELRREQGAKSPGQGK